MPGVGKSYYGKLAATELGMKFYDLDDEIVKLQKMSVSDIFSSKGESEFRKIEFEKTKEAAAAPSPKVQLHQ